MDVGLVPSVSKASARLSWEPRPLPPPAPPRGPGCPLRLSGRWAPGGGAVVPACSLRARTPARPSEGDSTPRSPSSCSRGGARSVRFEEFPALGRGFRPPRRPPRGDRRPPPPSSPTLIFSRVFPSRNGVLPWSRCPPRPLSPLRPGSCEQAGLRCAVGGFRSRQAPRPHAQPSGTRPFPAPRPARPRFLLIVLRLINTQRAVEISASEDSANAGKR